MTDATMTDAPYNIRNYRAADFNYLFLLFHAAEETTPIGRPTTPQAFYERLSRPEYDPAEDLVVVEGAGELVGFMEIVPEVGIGRIIIDCWLQPEHRERGLGKKLLGLAEKRARELGVRHIHANIRNDNLAAKEILRRLGFHFVRRFLEMNLDLRGVDTREMEAAFCDCRHLREGEEDILTDIQNRSFAEHWGYNPNTVETMTFRMSLSHRIPRDIVMACEDEEVTGYCWTEITGDNQGRIDMIGSDPEYRGRGIGRKLLLAGLGYLWKRGIENVRLTVDSENKVALALYESIGFKEHTIYLWYEKEVD